MHASRADVTFVTCNIFHLKGVIHNVFCKNLNDNYNQLWPNESVYPYFLLVRYLWNIFLHFSKFLKKNSWSTSCWMKPIFSSNVFPLTSEVGENAMEKIENNTSSFLTHSTARIVPLYVKKKISICDKTSKHTKRSLFYESK